MDSSYCFFCGQHCAVLRIIPDGPEQGQRVYLPTCRPGMFADMVKTGYTHETAINPVTEADQ